MRARAPKSPTVTKLSLKLAQNRQEQPNSEEANSELSEGWQRDLVGTEYRGSRPTVG